MNEHARISALRINLNDVEVSPASIIRAQEPTNLVRKAWIPQTLGDQIWVVYEFPSEEQRIRWEENLQGVLKKWLARDIIPMALPYGWYIRNPNGFVEGAHN